MKRILLLTIALLIVLSACAKPAETPAPDPTDPTDSTNPEPIADATDVPETDEPENAEPDATDEHTTTPMDPPVGSWRLSEDNDPDALSRAFDNAEPNNSAMEIGADRLLFWTVDSASGAGNFTVDGNTLIAELVRNLSGTPEQVLFTMEDGPTLIMNLNGASVRWVPVAP